MTPKKEKWVFSLLVITIFCFLNADKEVKTRNFLATGNWYPPATADLNVMLDHYLANAPVKEIPGNIVGIIGPHAGFIFSGQCTANAYKQLQISPQANQIERVIVMGISHSRSFYGAAVSSFDFESTPLGKIPVDTEITAKLAKEKFFQVNDQALQYEHSIENHLPFLQKTLKNKNFKIVSILFGRLDKKDFKTLAAIIKKYIDNKTLLVASTDLTHYGSSFDYTPFRTNLESNLTQLDMGIIKPIIGLDFEEYYDYKLKTGITMCGFTPVGVLVEIFADKKHRVALIDYYKSGDRNKDYTHNVSYASFIIYTDGERQGGKKDMNTSNNTEKNSLTLNEAEQKTLLRIARDTLELYLDNEKILEDVEKKYDISPNLKIEAGVFVTLKKKGDLRGCIGSIITREPLFLGVRNNAISSAVRDPRFSRVQTSELKDIDIEISVMTPLQTIDDYKKIRLGIDGVIIKKGYYQSVYLPQVATETGWNLDQFLGSLCQKAGLPSNSYLPSENTDDDDESMVFYIFQAQVFGEK
ncbi:MAG: AmmeMemoRadiSam system protein B [Acidobacteria bacterium]|jgi:hypothetical protein|nr:AmmeMemoRadiSam system protein B [Acidobacteriota bacterium]